jgi:hypothetical protein
MALTKIQGEIPMGPTLIMEDIIITNGITRTTIPITTTATITIPTGETAESTTREVPTCSNGGTLTVPRAAITITIITTIIIGTTITITATGIITTKLGSSSRTAKGILSIEITKLVRETTMPITTPVTKLAREITMPIITMEIIGNGTIMDMAIAVLVVTIRAITETGITGTWSRGQMRKKKQGLSVGKIAWRLETQRVGG